MGRRPRTAVWASALGIGMFQVVGTFGAADHSPHRRGVDAVALLLVVAGPVALAWRDRWPLVAAAVAVAAADVYVARGYAYGPIFLSVIVGLFAAVQAGDRRSTWAVAAAGYAGMVVALYVDPRSTHDPGAVHLALVAGWLAVVLAVSEVVRGRREQAAQLARAEEEERQRRVGEQRLSLAQELHDVLAHNISLINVQAGVALHLIDEQPEQARPALANIKEASREALRELRTALDVLRNGDGAPRAPAPTLADLDALVDGVRAGGLNVRLEQPTMPAASAPAPPPADVQLAAYRIVQEALTNVTRHAQASRATVLVTCDAASVRVEVTDDGVGGPAEAGNGIRGMQERATALGGTVDTAARPEGGFRVVALLPLSRP